MAQPDLEPPPARRSLLFVPGAEPRKLERARETAADTLLFDLEDSVPPAQKADARAHVAAVIRAGDFGRTEAAVRVNAPGTEHFEADVEAVIASGGRTIMLPKAESADGVAAAAAALRAGERAVGGADGVRLLLLIESPAGIAAAVAIGRAAPHVEALCFGHADFSLQMGLGDADASRGVVYHARCTLAIAARACGIAPIDSVFLAVRDDAAFREDAALGCRLGFDGKLCIHPRQVEIVNDVYTPGPEQVEYANRVVEAWAQAAAEGRGVFALDGRMIDAPVVAVQRQVLARARRAGVRGAARV
jgi:citrate lyase subunit beta/citryl-CoA lyase